MHNSNLNRSALNLSFALAAGTVILAYGCAGVGGAMQGLPAGYVSANGITGGKSFDKFWDSATGWNQADPNLAVFNAKSDFFRCKQCHGWDRLGSNGAYISRGPTANRPRVSSVDLRSLAATRTPQELFDGIKNSVGRRAINADLSTYDPNTNFAVGDQMPDVGSIFTDSQIWNLVKYLKAEAVDVSQLYDFLLNGTYPTGSIAYSNIGLTGNAASGTTTFTVKCAGCHGANGTAIIVDGSYHVGSFIRAKPNEAQHKIKFGQLGSMMGAQGTTLTQMRDLYRALSDPVNFPD